MGEDEKILYGMPFECVTSTATMHLRQFAKFGLNGPYILQQAWIDSRGRVEWRDVPFVAPDQRVNES